MLRMTLDSMYKWSTIHHVHKDMKLLGSISVWTDHQFEPYHDVTACSVHGLKCAHFETVIDAIKWLNEKDGEYNV